MHHPVLLCYDGSAESRRAIQVAGHLLAGSRATVVHVASATSWALSASVGSLVETSYVADAMDVVAREVLDEGVRIAGAAGFLAAGELRRADGPVWRELLAAASEHRVLLIVAGSHHHPMRDHLPFGSVTHQLLVHADRPVLVTHRADVTRLARLRTEPRPRLLMAHDGTEASDAAIDVTCDLFPDASMCVVTAGEASIAVDGAGIARERGVASAPLKIAAEQGVGRAIVETARELDVDLISLGCSEPRARAHRSLGPIANFVLQHADRPVVLLPHDPRLQNSAAVVQRAVALRR
jgi:nucleotide-binding universal stress UspA family protein